jgi:hypothetical protein
VSGEIGMDNGKLEGILSAIEAEAKIPAPSHQNLARLIAMFFRELMAQMEELKK